MVGSEYFWLFDAYHIDHPSIRSQDVVTPVSEDYYLADLPTRLLFVVVEALYKMIQEIHYPK